MTKAQHTFEKLAAWITASDFEFNNNKKSMAIMTDSKLNEAQKKAKLIKAGLGRNKK